MSLAHYYYSDYNKVIETTLDININCCVHILYKYIDKVDIDYLSSIDMSSYYTY